MIRQCFLSLVEVQKDHFDRLCVLLKLLLVCPVEKLFFVPLFYPPSTFGVCKASFQVTHPVRCSDQYLTCTCTAPAGYPRIVESPTLKAVEKDRNAVMLCSATGNPDPTITWLKDYIPVDTTDPRLKVLATGKSRP